jgi:hypothetical protein
MSDERPLDTWGRLEVEWRDALEAATERQREYDSRMTNHLVYHLAQPDLQELGEISRLWRLVYEKREAADDYIRQHCGHTSALSNQSWDMSAEGS